MQIANAQANTAKRKESWMRRLLVSALILSAYCGVAQAYQDCLGFSNAPKLRIFWDRKMVQVDGAFFQMQKQDRTLSGHGMVVKQGGKRASLTQGGSTYSYICAAGLTPNSGPGEVNAQKPPVRK